MFTVSSLLLSTRVPVLFPTTYVLRILGPNILLPGHTENSSRYCARELHVCHVRDPGCTTPLNRNVLHQVVPSVCVSRSDGIQNFNGLNHLKRTFFFLVLYTW